MLRRSVAQIAVLALSLLAVACTHASVDSADDNSRPTIKHKRSPAVEAPTTTATLERQEVMELATRAWRTLLTTTLSEDMWVLEPAVGPDRQPVAMTASGPIASIWDFNQESGWSVAATVNLEGQSSGILEPFADGLNDGFIPITTNGVGKFLRFLIPTYYGNGIAVAAVGYVDESWVLMHFDGHWGDSAYAMDAEITDDGIVAWINDCLPSCAEGRKTAVLVERTPDGYFIPSPAPRPAPTPTAQPQNLVNIVSVAAKQALDSEYGWEDYWDCPSPKLPFLPGDLMICNHGAWPMKIVAIYLIDLEGRFTWEVWGYEETEGLDLH